MFFCKIIVSPTCSKKTCSDNGKSVSSCSGSLSCRSISAGQAERLLQQVLDKHGTDGPRCLQANCRVSVLISVGTFPGPWCRAVCVSGQPIQLTTPVLLCSASSSQLPAMLASSRQPPALCSQLLRCTSPASCTGSRQAASPSLTSSASPSLL